MNTTPETLTTPFTFATQFESHPDEYAGTDYSAYAVRALAYEIAKTYVMDEDFNHSANEEIVWDMALDQLATTMDDIDEERTGMYTEFVADNFLTALEPVFGDRADRVLEKEIDRARSRLDHYHVYWNNETQDWDKKDTFEGVMIQLVEELKDKYNAWIK